MLSPRVHATPSPAALLRPLGLAAALLGCAAPRTRVSSPTRAASSRATTVPFRLIDNRLFVDARVNGRGPYAFIFDTGGANLVTPSVARELALDTAATGEATGAGEGRTPMQTARIREFRVGDRALVDESFMVIDLGQIQRAFGFARLDGVFGYEMLTRFVATIDYDAGRVASAEPAWS